MPTPSWDMTLQRSRTKYHFNPRGMLETITDEFGNRIRYLCDTNDRVLQMIDDSGSGRLLNIYWNPTGRIDWVVDSAGRTVRYGYDAVSGMLTSVTDPANRLTSYVYVNNSYGTPVLTQVKDHWNRVVTRCQRP